MSEENTNVYRVVQELIADYERQDCYLTEDQVTRLLQKRKLSIEECAEVFNQLENIGISIEDSSHSLGHDLIAELFKDDETERFNGDDSFFSRFLLSIPNIKLLTPEEENQLGYTIQLGRLANEDLNEGADATEFHHELIGKGIAAQKQMVLSNLRLVHHVAKSYTNLSSLSFEDLVQEGTLGLMRATIKFDHTLGYKFSTYATWWIRQGITRAIIDKGAPIRLPAHMFEDVAKYRKAHRLIEQVNFGEKPELTQLADELAWEIDKVHYVSQVASLVPKSVNDAIDGNEDLKLIDLLVSSIPGPEKEQEREERACRIFSVLETLDEREKDIIEKRFGLGVEKADMTLEAIGEIYGVSRERIRQIEKNALDRLKHPVRSSLLEVFYEE